MSRRLPPLNALRAFEAAGRHLSFSKAAEELHVTPAAVSHHIKALEENLGVTLFRREPRRLLLTDAGQRALPGVREAFDGLAATLADIGENPNGDLLTISAVPSLAAKWLVPRMERFRRAHPRIELRLDATSRVVDFERETDVDVALRHGLGNYPSLHVDCIMPASLRPVCSPRLLEGEHPLNAPEDLRYHTLLHVPWQSQQGGIEPNWREWLATAGVTGIDAERGPRFNDTNFALQAAIEGHGVALASDALVSDDIAQGRLVHPFGRGVSGATPFGYFLVYPPRKAKLRRVQAFRDWIRAEVAAYNAADGEKVMETCL